jgi:lysine-specific demethylase/histidyl-hydroxylase NO66
LFKKATTTTAATFLNDPARGMGSTAKKRMTDEKPAVVTNQQGQSRASKKRAKKKQKSGSSSDRLLVEPPSRKAAAAAAAADPPRSTADQERPCKEPRESQEDEGLDFFEEEATKKVHFEAADDDNVGGDNHGEGDSRGSDEGSMKKKPQPPCGDASDSSLGGTAESPLLPPPPAKTIAELLAPPSCDDGPTEATAATTEQRARGVLDFLLRPAGISADEFYAGYWEKRPLLVQFRGSPPPSKMASDPHSDPHRDDHRRRLSGLMSLSGIQAATRQQQGQQQGQRLPGDDESGGSVLCYGRDLNVTKYERDAGTGLHRRRTLDPAAPPEPDGAAPDTKRYAPVDPDELWGRFYGGMGCTVRLLCPHRHFGPVHSLLSLLEHEFGCMVGANAYLTPPGSSQGFAPHYDDVEAFVCQLEGRKRWRVHAPLRDAERLPRASSRDYDPSELARAGSLPVLDAVLEPGDVLYMPRGWIHHACTLPEAELSGGGPSEPSAREDGHSLHLTVSTMQNWAWADLLEGLFEGAIGSLAGSGSTALLLREGLPRNFLSYTGVAHDPVEDAALPDSLKRGRPPAARDGVGGEEEDEEDAEEAARLRRHERLRDEFRREARRRIARVAQEALRGLDAACDEMAKRFVSDRLPPAGLHLDRGASVGGESGDDRELQLTTLCRLARPGIARLVLEDGKAVVYHCADNSLVYHGKPLSPLEFEADDGPALEQLVTTVEPRWVAVQDLFHDTPDDKLAVAQALYDEGILAVRSE